MGGADSATIASVISAFKFIALMVANLRQPQNWIVDYLALASKEYLNQPKVPTISIYLLNDGQDQVSQFRGSDRLISSTFPKLDLTVEQVVAASLP